MIKDDIYQTHLTAQQNLRRLSIIRGVALLGQFLALVFFGTVNPIGLPLVPITIILSIYSAITAATWLRSKQPVPIVDYEFFTHLLIVIFFFSMLLYFSGGASNPFVSYYLIPLSIAAITLPRRLSILVALAALACYTVLLNYYVPIAAIAPHAVDMHGTATGMHGTATGMNRPATGMNGVHSGAFNESVNESTNLHILGMWANFAISGALITYFISRMAGTLRQQQQKIAEQRETQLRDEQLLAVATLAAGTAHELGTPLNTMKIIVDELIDKRENSAEDLLLLNQQIDTCKSTLKQLLMTAEQSQSSEQTPVTVRDYFSALLSRWQLMRPNVNVSINLAKDSCDAPCTAAFHLTIEQSIINLLNNAADASPESVEVSIQWTADRATIDIRDHGLGLDLNGIDNLGQAFVTHKDDGLGLGLFLSRATLTRFGGTVSLRNALGGGTHTQISLPL
jgi:two-component system sensor histidine kinase RegB